MRLVRCMSSSLEGRFPVPVANVCLFGEIYMPLHLGPFSTTSELPAWSPRRPKWTWSCI